MLLILNSLKLAKARPHNILHSLEIEVAYLVTCTYKLLKILKIPIETIQNLVYSSDLLSALGQKVVQ